MLSGKAKTKLIETPKEPGDNRIIKSDSCIDTGQEKIRETISDSRKYDTSCIHL